MNLILIIIITILILIYLKSFKNETFVSYLSIVDPFSLYLHKNITEKEDWWNETHAKNFYYYQDYVPQIYME